jgi:hypothetical protein
MIGGDGAGHHEAATGGDVADRKLRQAEEHRRKVWLSCMSVSMHV